MIANILARELMERATEMRLSGRLDDADSLDFFVDILRATRHEDRKHEYGGPEPVSRWLTRTVASSIDHDPADHDTHCDCERCPHCGEVIE